MKTTFAAALVLVLVTGCAGLGGILGGDPNSSGTYPTTTQSGSLVGTVNSVNTSARRIDLAVDDYNGTTRNTSVYYDNSTRVVYQGQNGSPSQLERGDRIDVRLYTNGNQTLADTITVLNGMASSGSNPYPNTQNASIQGTVSYVDTSAKRIDITPSYVTGLRGSGTSSGNYSIYYDNRTRVTYQGRDYAPTDLERGDQVTVSVVNNGNNSYLADTITVVRNVRQ